MTAAIPGTVKPSIAATIVFVDVSTTEIVVPAKLDIYARLPSGVIATAADPVKPGMVVETVLVEVSITETVLDAISQIQGLTQVSSKRIWIARPQPGGTPHDEILPVNWQEIAKGAATAMNYQVLPGDRIFVVDQAAAKTRIE